MQRSLYSDQDGGRQCFNQRKRLCGRGFKRNRDSNGRILEYLRACESAESEDTDASAASLPPEVVIEILCWLPLRSLGKLQVVCKEWRGFILDRYLMERNMDRRAVTCHWQNSVDPYDEAKPDQNGEGFLLLDGIDGLILLMSTRTMKFTIWNPATYGVLRLPDQHMGSFGVTLNYVKSTGNYLVVSVYKDESGRESCQALTPGMSESWRPLAFPDVSEAEGRRERQHVQVVSAEEAVHTVLVVKVGSTVTKKVVSLDLETERFNISCFAQTEYKNLKSLWAIDWNGTLALATLDGTNLHVTELEDYKKQRWCHQNKVIPLPFLREESDHASILVPLFAKNGDVWFRYGGSRIVIQRIETGRYTYMRTTGLSPTGKLYPYKPTFVGLQ